MRNYFIFVLDSRNVSFTTFSTTASVANTTAGLPQWGKEFLHYDANIITLDTSTRSFCLESELKVHILFRSSDHDSVVTKPVKKIDGIKGQCHLFLALHDFYGIREHEQLCSTSSTNSFFGDSYRNY